MAKALMKIKKKGIPLVDETKETTFMVELLFLCLALLLPILVIVLSQPQKLEIEAKAPAILDIKR